MTKEEFLNKWAPQEWQKEPEMENDLEALLETQHILEEYKECEEDAS